ncbi:hypothetical protein K2173_010518 [Erythroxylum novogranatense]|uniref:Uncharacterized protein n=1 Tax=Erythroxylum novogranatense TaxID=1862640 RepID=A0AAV8TDV3_9ROSI|nr:hypothetical protein K2173_010518 [Erythroxylum novogranatense]
MAEKQPEDHSTNKLPQSSVTSVYEVEVADLSRSVTVTWSKNLMNYSLVISVENVSDENHYTCKIELKTWQFWGKKGLKSFDVDGKRVDIYWDFRQAKFTNNPEPSSDYYVAMVYGDEVVLVLGDLKKDAFKRTKKRPSLVEPILLCKKENVFGKKLFCTKTMLCSGDREHDVVIEISSSGFGDPEMWISIDGFEVIHVMNLNWRFRGNESVTTINNVLVQIFWDVHDWLFSDTGTGSGLFILQPGALECSSDSVRGGRNSNSNSGRSHDSALELPSNADQFFHIIYAWKFE